MFIKQFFSFLEYEKRYSPHTLISYKKDIAQFSGFLSKTFETELLKASHQMVRSWVIDLAEAEIAPASIGRKLSSLKSLYKFLLKEGMVDANPATAV